jgi:tRNA(Ile)-lysidine synthase
VLLKRLDKTLAAQNLLFAHDRVIVGVSAGSDSVALLCLLCRTALPLSPIAVYIDHGLRPEETPAEAELVQELARQFNLPFRQVTIDVKGYHKKHHCSLEEAARILRYSALEKCRQEFGAKAIAIAHTADDQAEEILLRLIRGTGLSGLSGMRLITNILIRPLLNERKMDLTAYLQESGIPYCYDSSNSDPAFLRNRVRLELLPVLEEKYNPAMRAHLLQTADILQQDEDLLHEITARHYPNCISVPPDGKDYVATELLLAIPAFLKCHKAIRRRIVEKLCWHLEIRPSFRRIEQIHDLATGGTNGAELHLAKGIRIFKSASSLHFCRPCGKLTFRGNFSPDADLSLQINGQGTYQAAGLGMSLSLRLLQRSSGSTDTAALLIDGDKITFPLLLRSHLQGERFIPQGMHHHKKISRFLSDLKISRQARHRYPVLVSDAAVVAVVGLRIDERFAVDEATTNLMEIRWQPSADSRL